MTIVSQISVMDAQTLMIQCSGEILLKADFTPMVLASKWNATQLQSSHGFTVMHAYLFGHFQM